MDRVRLRTLSADSGCDTGTFEDLSLDLLEENVSVWSSMLESLFKQKLDCIKEDLKIKLQGKITSNINELFSQLILVR